MNKQGRFGFLAVIFLIIVIILLIFIGVKYTGNVPSEPDSDGDGLSDIEEKRLGTDPFNKNTDGDRYPDGKEIELGLDPKKPNSAKISYVKINPKENYHEWVLIRNSAKIAGVLIACGSGNLGACASTSVSVFNKIDSIIDETIYTSSGEFILTNVGDDHTNFINFDIIYSIGDEILKVEPKHSEKVNPNERVIAPYIYEFKIKDIKHVFWDMIFNRKKIDVKIDENSLDYETYG